MRHAQAILAVVLVVTACAAPDGAQRAAAPIASVATVPAARFEPIEVPGTQVFGAAPEDLAAKGYVEQEYAVSGSARRYAFPAPLGNAVPLDAGHAYRTRMIVRRPADPARFNGTVVIEWFNVTLGQDVDFIWASSREHLMRSGYAFVALSAQRVGVERLKGWSPARYGNLNVSAPDTDPPDPLHTGDVLSWDIFSQTVQALRRPGAVDALHGLAVRRVIAAGESQAGRRLTTYYNAIDPLHRVVDGMVFYDPGYSGLDGRMTWHLLRTDNPTKLISVGAEVWSDGREVVPDGPTTRRWEVAGTSHLSHWDMLYVDAMTRRDKALRTRDGKAVDTIGDLIPGCAHYPLWSAVPAHHVLNAAFEHVNAWAAGGPPAPPGKPLERQADGRRLRHDANGRTFGGIQLAEFVAPTAFNLGFLNPGPGFCRNGGHHRFFSADEMRARYPDAQAHVRRVVETTMKNLADGYIVGADAAATVRTAYDRPR